MRTRLAADPAARPAAEKIIELVHAGSYDGAKVAVEDGVVVVDAGPVRAVATLGAWSLRYTDAAGKTLVAQNPGEEDISGRLRTLPFGRSLVDGEPVAFHESFTAAPDEAYAGFGERFAPLNARGQRPLMWNFDAFGSESIRAYKNVPFYVSDRGYGVLVNSGAPVEFDMAQQTHAAVELIVPDDALEYFVIGGTPVEVLDRFDGLTSRPSLPRSGPSAPGSPRGSSWTTRSGSWSGPRRSASGASPATCSTSTRSGSTSRTGPTCSGTARTSPTPSGCSPTSPSRASRSACG
nr:hypothetical protein GCM10025732_48930 [Glycomyces mayteni]